MNNHNKLPKSDDQTRIIAYLQTVRRTHIAGAFRSMLELAAAEYKHGRKIEAWVTVTTQRDEVKEYAKNCGVPIRFVSKIGLILRLLLLRVSFWKKFVVRIHSGLPTVSSRARLLRLIIGPKSPLLWFLHGPFQLASFQNKIVANQHLKNANIPDALLVPSSSERAKQISIGVDPKKIFVVPNIVAIGASKGTHEIESNDNCCPSVLFCARIEEEKGCQELIEAFIRLADGLQTTLVIAGEGSQLTRCRMIAEPLKERVKFLGHVPNPSSLYSNSTIFVAPSSAESFGRTAFEAALYKLPMVLSRIAPWTEMFEEGEHCLFVDPKSPNEIADAIELLLNNNQLRLKLANAAKKRVEILMSPRSTLESINQIYTNLEAISEDSKSTKRGS